MCVWRKLNLGTRLIKRQQQQKKYTEKNTSKEETVKAFTISIRATLCCMYCETIKTKIKFSDIASWHRLTADFFLRKPHLYIRHQLSLIRLKSNIWWMAACHQVFFVYRKISELKIKPKKKFFHDRHVWCFSNRMMIYNKF